MNKWIRLQHTIGLPLARHALEAALDAAEAASLRISVAVVDAGGQLIHMAHMDGAPVHSRDIALNKAITAAGFGVSTSLWTSRLEHCSPAVRHGLPLQPRMALFGGGEPFIACGAALGAIGVSGASEADDTRCALAAIERFKALLKDSAT